MKTMSTKANHAAAVEAFIAAGGKITKCPTMKPKQKKQREVKVVEIEVEHLPPELAKKYFSEEV